MSEARCGANPTRDHNGRCQLIVDAAAERYPATIVDDPATPEWYDLVLTNSEHEYIGIATPIKARGCMARLPSNEYRRGRWEIRQPVHDQLLAADGMYALGVYDERDEIHRLSLLPASDVALLVEGRWTDESGGERAQLPWSKVFNDLERSNGGDGT